MLQEGKGGRDDVREGRSVTTCPFLALHALAGGLVTWG